MLVTYARAGTAARSQFGQFAVDGLQVAPFPPIANAMEAKPKTPKRIIEKTIANFSLDIKN